MNADLVSVRMLSLIALCAAAGMSFPAIAADFYVSSDKSYGVAEGADSDHIFDDLQLAINAAVKDDTVWVEDGFEVDSGIGYTTAGNEARIYIDKVMTVRSKSGDWRENGPIICGKYADAYDGTDASRCG